MEMPEKEKAATEPQEEGFRVVDKRGGAEPEVEPVALDCSEDNVRRLMEENERLEGELEKRRERINELARGLQDIGADRDGMRDRLEREQTKAVNRAKGQLLEKLLHVLDTFQHSLDSIPVTEHTRDLLEGVKMIYRQFLVQLGDLGLERFSPLGDTFDPESHEALRTDDVEDSAQNGRILKVIVPGYKHGGRVLRPAQVVVGRYTAPPVVETPESEEKEETKAEESE